MICRSCQFESPAGFDFCGKCGRPLAEHQAERRQVSVVFCDLVNSTEIAEQLDEEALREIYGELRDICALAMSHLDGHISNVMGDGVLMCFGYPQAHEDDAGRAVVAGLEIIDGVAARGGSVKQTMGVQMSVRLAIHTGLVIAEPGTGGTVEILSLIGETVNVASRLQSVAKPGTLVISETTHNLVSRSFKCVELGHHILRGISRPMTLYQVVSELEVPSATDIGRLSPLVGRDNELNMLLNRWNRAIRGEGQVVLIRGEPGIGKSRLVQEFSGRIENEPNRTLRFHCSRYYENSTLFPVIEGLRRWLAFDSEDTDEVRLEKLEAAAGQIDTGSTPLVPALATLLRIPLSEEYSQTNLTPQQQRDLILQTVGALLTELAKQKPLLLIFEDLHWADPTTLELLGLMLDLIASVPVMILLACRPVFINPRSDHVHQTGIEFSRQNQENVLDVIGWSEPWSGRAYLTRIELSRLAQEDVRDVIGWIARGKPLPGAILGDLIAKTDGVPLFVEELTKSILESGLLRETHQGYEPLAPAQAIKIPGSLRDSLMERLDRLSDTKKVAQLAATIGREFSYELLHAASDLEEPALEDDLGKLVQAELIYQTGEIPNASYWFKHSLIRDIAYDTLLTPDRQKHHGQIAMTLLGRFQTMVEAQPEMLAYHYTEAGQVEEAIQWWRRAGNSSTQRSANVEAISHFTKGIELVSKLPNCRENHRTELELQIALGMPTVALSGFASVEAETVYKRALQLSGEFGQTHQIIAVLLGMGAAHVVRCELQTALEFAQQIMHLAQETEDDTFRLAAHAALGVIYFWQGEFQLSRDNFDQVTTRYSIAQHRSLALDYGQDWGVVSLSHLALALWALGYPEQAIKSGQDAISLAGELNNPFNIVYALVWNSHLHQLHGDTVAAAKYAEQALALAEEHEFLIFKAMATSLRGGSLCEQGRLPEGMADLQNGLENYLATGALLSSQYYKALLAEAQGKAGQGQQGYRLIEDTLSAARENGELFYEAEILRIKGELTNAVFSPDYDESESYYRQALAVARLQEAKSLELRAALSLSKLLRSQGKRDEAYAVLVDVYQWFAEGLQTRDLLEAKQLLATLT